MLGPQEGPQPNPQKMFNKRLQNAHDPNEARRGGGEPSQNRAHNRVGESVQANPNQTAEQIRQQILQATETKLENKGVYKHGNDLSKLVTKPNPMYDMAQKSAMEAANKAMKAHENDVIMRENASDVAGDILKKSQDAIMFDTQTHNKTSEFGIEDDSDVSQDMKKFGKQLSMHERTDRPTSVSKVLNPNDLKPEHDIINMGEKKTAIHEAEPEEINTSQNEGDEIVADSIEMPDGNDYAIDDERNAANERLKKRKEIFLNKNIDKKSRFDMLNKIDEDYVNKQRSDFAEAGFSDKSIHLLENAGYIGVDSAIVRSQLGIDDVTPGNVNLKGVPNAGKFVVESTSFKPTQFGEHLKKHQDDIIGFVGDKLGLTDEPDFAKNQKIYITEPSRNEDVTSCVVMYSGFDGVDGKKLDSAVRDVISKSLEEFGDTYARLGKKTYSVTNDELTNASINMQMESEKNEPKVSNTFETQDIDPSLDSRYQSYLEQMDVAEQFGPSL